MYLVIHLEPLPSNAVASFRLMAYTASSKHNSQRALPNIPEKTVTPESLSGMKQIPHHVCQTLRLWPLVGFQSPFYSLLPEVPLASCLFLRYGDISPTVAWHPLSSVCLKVILSPSPPLDHPA